MSLINLAHKCYSERVDYVDTVLDVTKNLFDNAGIEVVEYCSPVGRELEKLLSIPINNYNDIITVLSLKFFTPLLGMYDFEGRRAMAVYIANNVIDNETYIATAEQTETILGILSPLIQDQDDGPTPDKWDDLDEFAEEQSLMGRLVHMLRAKGDPDQQYQIISTARKHFGLGGPQRIGSTLPPIVMFAYKLAQEYYSIRHQDEKWQKKVIVLKKVALTPVIPDFRFL